MNALRKNLAALKASECDHKGLLLARYVPTVDSDIKTFLQDREFFLDAAVGKSKATEELYRKAFDRWKASFPPEALLTKFDINGRFVSGLGAESPLETGLRLHHTYGTPVIPGSAIKGLTAHYCNRVWGVRDREFKKEIDDHTADGAPSKRAGHYFKTLFGTTDRAGHITFHDALITPESLKSGALVKDVMTVHHPDYYQKEGAVPTDFDNPTPIPFISVTGSFIVPLECDAQGEEGEKWSHLTLALVAEALIEWGIGGKTNAGYGRMSCKEIAQKAHAPQAGSPGAHAPSTHSSTPTPLGDFLSWFTMMKFSGANKQHHGQIKDKIEKLGDMELKKQAKAHIEKTLNAKNTTSAVLTYLESLK